MQEFDLDCRLVSLPDADQSFPRVLSLAGDEAYICVRLNISPDLHWFRGHFPDQAVLPGVIQLHWAVLIAQACFGFSSVPAEIKRLKFKKIVTPPAELELTVSRHGPAAVQFEFSSSDAKNSEGRLFFDEKPAC